MPEYLYSVISLTKSHIRPPTNKAKLRSHTPAMID